MDRQPFSWSGIAELATPWALAARRPRFSVQHMRRSFARFVSFSLKFYRNGESAHMESNASQTVSKDPLPSFRITSYRPLKTSPKWTGLESARSVRLGPFAGRASHAKPVLFPRGWFLSGRGQWRRRHPLDVWGYVDAPVSVNMRWEEAGGEIT